jgi:molecular chaperone DnaK (HSP70)
MAERTRPALGLSIGATNLAAVTPDHSITRKPVLTLYRQRPPVVGVPSENPRLDEPGLVINDFVDRVGDPVGIVAADGSVHRSEALVADGLRALAYTATGGRPLPESVAVTYPAHWAPKAVDALGSALSRVSEWSSRGRPLTLIPDAAATLLALRANPGIPVRGIVAVCDFGGSGTSITLVDAAAEYHPVGPTVRHHDFSGDRIDQALLTVVIDDMPSTGSFDPAGTSAIGSLSRMRVSCRGAKEQLSSSTVTTLADELPGSRGGIRLTRNELDDAIRDSLRNFTAVLEEALVRNGIRGSDLVAVVSVGGGANLPAVTTMLSGTLRVPVVTMPRPQLAAAIGGALRAARGPADTTATALTPTAPATVAEASASEDPVSRLQLEPKSQVIPWYRLPAVVIIGAAVAALLVGTAVAIGLSSGDKPTTTPAPSVSTTPALSAPVSGPPPSNGTPQSAPTSAPAQP